jgi:hypothetical protein
MKLYLSAELRTVLGEEAAASLPPVAGDYRSLCSALYDMERALSLSYDMNNLQEASRASHTFLMGFLKLYRAGKVKIVEVEDTENVVLTPLTVSDKMEGIGGTND